MTVICLYQLCALFEQDVYITLFKQGHVMFSGYLDKLPDKYAKYPVVHMRTVTDNHYMIQIV